jgi:hypothetical protein
MQMGDAVALDYLGITKQPCRAAVVTEEPDALAQHHRD